MSLEADLLSFLPKLKLHSQPRNNTPVYSQRHHSPLLVVSFRIPFHSENAWSDAHEGGVAAMLSSLQDAFCPTWLTIGENGILLRDKSESEVVNASHNVSQSTMTAHYKVSNEILWPLFHGLSPPFISSISEGEWFEYLAINCAMADAISSLRKASHVLINDYHFVMTPQFLSKDDLQSTIFFFHCSFPSFESISCFPWIQEIIRSISACGAIGFQTTNDLARFQHCQSQYNLLNSEGSLFVSPSTVDFPRWEQKVNTLNTQTLRSRIQELFQAEHILLAVDRIDPVKGIDLKLEALELNLQQESRSTDIALIQIAPPSRDRLPLYREIRQRIEHQVAFINARYQNRVCLIETLLSQEALAALYRSCDGLVVSSRREGMNLVAQEFIACRSSEPGALLLSENTGLACRVPQLGSINPYDIESLAFRMRTIGESPIQLNDWDLGVELLRKSSPMEWAQKVGSAINGV